MAQRLDYIKASPASFRAMMGVEQHVAKGVDGVLMHLLKLRASQINGCAYCIDMHWKDARAAGQSEERLYALSAWRESTLYSDRERAVLAWTESLTLIADEHAEDGEYEGVRAHFSDTELADLTWAIAAINAWNRIAIGFRAKPGLYRPRPAASAASAAAT
ncbi:carboxymuconolactone decarboxylase family protein [soil metagenome]